eukprot:CFRG6573T1
MYHPIVIFFVALVFSANVLAGSIVLTDENFEHKTQASTGSTTGLWFNKFYAPWCGHCKELAPVWDELADRLAGEVNVASIDCDGKGADTCERFEVESYPTLHLIASGKYYKYEGPREIDEMAAFALGGYEDEKGVQVPNVPSALDALLKPLFEFPNTVLKFWKRNPVSWLTIAIIVAGIGAVIMVCMPTKSSKKNNTVPKALKKKKR